MGFGVIAAVTLALMMPRITPQTRVTQVSNQTHCHGVESRPPNGAETRGRRVAQGGDRVVGAAAVRDVAVEARRDPPEEDGREARERTGHVVPVAGDEDHHQDEGEDADPEGDAPEVGSVGRLEGERHRDEGRHRAEDRGQEDLAEGGVVATGGEEQAPRDEGRGEDQVEVLRKTERPSPSRFVLDGDPVEREVQGEFRPEEGQDPDHDRERRDRFGASAHEAFTPLGEVRRSPRRDEWMTKTKVVGRATTAGDKAPGSRGQSTAGSGFVASVACPFATPVQGVAGSAPAASADELEQHRREGLRRVPDDPPGSARSPATTRTPSAPRRSRSTVTGSWPWAA